MSSSRAVASRPGRLRSGYWKLREKLHGDSFDEHFYLGVYPDVAAAVGRGQYATAFHHYSRWGRAEGRRAVPSEASIDLLEAGSTSMVYLELTTRCNLRCVYCPVSQPTYRGSDLPIEPVRLDTFLRELHERRVEIVVMNGHGESTIVKDWEALAMRFADAGFRLHITTNLAKRLTFAEIDALSRFELILLSLDTVDGELLAELRRGARLEVILDNLRAIRELASQRRRTPELAVSCVVSDQSASHLGDLVDVLLDRGIRTFRFGDLVEYPPIEGTVTARHVTHLLPDVLVAACADFRAALERIAQRGGVAHVDPPLTAILLEQRGESVRGDVRDAVAGAKTVHHDGAAGEQTRDCLDPWRTAFVQATGEVRPCCFFEETIGGLAVDSLVDILEGDDFRELRRNLLDGELPRSCAECHARPLIDRQIFREKVRSRLEEDQLGVERARVTNTR